MSMTILNKEITIPSSDKTVLFAISFYLCHSVVYTFAFYWCPFTSPLKSYIGVSLPAILCKLTSALPP